MSKAQEICYGNDTDNGHFPLTSRLSPSAEGVSVMSARMSIRDLCVVAGVVLAGSGLVATVMWNISARASEDAKQSRLEIKESISAVRVDVGAIRTDVWSIRESHARMGANMSDFERRVGKIEAAVEKKP